MKNPSPGALVRAFGQRANKALGQHFLNDINTLQEITEAAQLSEGAYALEIGPGPGVLTAPLLGAGARVLALEKDRRAVEFLRGDYASLVGAEAAARLEVVEGDALEVDLEGALRSRHEGPWVVVSNLPYNVGTAIVLRLLALEAPVSRMVLMFQREVALRLVAAPGSRDYGSLSLAVQARAEAGLLFDVPPERFSPPPAVTSSVVLVTPRPHPEVPPALLGRFEEVVKAAFAARRKTIQNSLSRNLPQALRGATLALLEEAGIDPRDRAEVVDLPRYARLARAVEAALR